MSRNDFGLRFGEPKQYYGNVPDGRTAMKRGGDVMPKRNKKNFRPTEKGAGMTRAGMMGGGMMRKDTMMKKGGKIPPQLKKFVMAKKKKAAMKKKKA
jgi:hypothetical protein